MKQRQNQGVHHPDQGAQLVGASFYTPEVQVWSPVGRIWEQQMGASVSTSVFLFLSLKSIKKYISSGEDLKKKDFCWSRC